MFVMRAPSSPMLAKVLSAVNYIHGDLWSDIGDPRVSDYILFDGGPWMTLAIVSAYLYFVLVFGPRYMKKREAYSLKNFALVYNIAMVILNGWIFIEGMELTKFGRDCWGCQLVDTNTSDPKELRKLDIGHWFFMSKIVELIDTVIFILRKKWNQVSVLHVVHHSLVPILIWLGYKISPGGNMALFQLLNSAIHTIMYTYYGLSTFGPAVRRHLWWKKYLTTIQMIQFVVVMIHSLHVLFLPRCAFPKILLYISLSNAILFFILFYSFYRATYGRSRTKRLLSSNGDTIKTPKLRSDERKMINNNTKID